MILARKIRIIPTPEQEEKFIKSAGVARWAYNYFIGTNFDLYDSYIKNGKTGNRYISGNDLRKIINNDLKKTTHTWLSEVGSNVMKQAVKDAEKAYADYINGVSGKPKFKKKGKSEPSFYVNYESLKKTSNGFHGERLGNVRTAEPLPTLQDGEKYINPKIKYDGKYWYISVGYRIEPKEVDLKDISIGIDLGIKELATVSDGTVYKNINKSKRVRKLKKKLKREQRKLSRMIEDNIDHHVLSKSGKGIVPVYKRKLSDCKNIQKQKKKIKLIYRTLRNIRENNLHQVTTEIVKTKPSRIVIEDLNVSGMMKNKHLSGAVQEQKFYRFREMLEYKSELYGITLDFADRWYPSSKTCSCCGNIKKDLKLKDGVYRCLSCGIEIDRDLNASINLSNYKFA